MPICNWKRKWTIVAGKRIYYRQYDCGVIVPQLRFLGKHACMNRQLQAGSYIMALADTTQRYTKGFIEKSTWRKHIQALWGAIAYHGLTKEVLALMREGMPS